MSIIRSPRPQRNYSIIDNAIIRNQKLTRGARALLIEILSYPDNWRTNSLSLSNAGLEGRDAIRRMMRELEEAGYCRCIKQQDQRGRWNSSWYFYDYPIIEDPAQKDMHMFRLHAVDNMGTVSKDAGLPAPDKPTSESQALIEQLITNDCVKNSETFFGSARSLCGQCKGEGVLLDDHDNIQVCSDCKGDGTRRP